MFRPVPQLPGLAQVQAQEVRHGRDDHVGSPREQAAFQRWPERRGMFQRHAVEPFQRLQLDRVMFDVQQAWPLDTVRLRIGRRAGAQRCQRARRIRQGAPCLVVARGLRALRRRGRSPFVRESFGVCLCLCLGFGLGLKFTVQVAD